MDTKPISDTVPKRILNNLLSSLEAGASAVLKLLSLWVSAVSSTVNSVSAVPDFETMEIVCFPLVSVLKKSALKVITVLPLSAV